MATRTTFGIATLFAMLCACAPRADRKALLMERAHELASGLEGVWVDGLKAYGESLFYGRAGCATCHRVGDVGQRWTGPNLGVDPACAGDRAAHVARDPVACEPLAGRVEARRPGLSAIEYVVESVLDPDRVIVPTYAPKVMKRLDQPPVSLTDDEILAIAAFVSGGACPKQAADIAAARHFFGPCRLARDR